MLSQINGTLSHEVLQLLLIIWGLILRLCYILCLHKFRRFPPSPGKNDIIKHKTPHCLYFQLENSATVAQKRFITIIIRAFQEVIVLENLQTLISAHSPKFRNSIFFCYFRLQYMEIFKFHYSVTPTWSITPLCYR